MAVQTTKSEITVGPALGNGIAYFLIAWINYKYEFAFDDPLMAIAMGGAIIGSVIVGARRMILWAARVIEHRSKGNA